MCIYIVYVCIIYFTQLQKGKHIFHRKSMAGSPSLQGAMKKKLASMSASWKAAGHAGPFRVNTSDEPIDESIDEHGPKYSKIHEWN